VAVAAAADASLQAGHSTNKSFGSQNSSSSSSSGGGAGALLQASQQRRFSPTDEDEDGNDGDDDGVENGGDCRNGGGNGGNGSGSSGSGSSGGNGGSSSGGSRSSGGSGSSGSSPRFQGGAGTAAPSPPSPKEMALEAAIRARPDVVQAGASVEERLASLQKHDERRIEDLNAKIRNAIVVNESGNKSAFAAAGGASFAVSAGAGLFLMDIGLGTPPAALPMIMDTGSQLVWTQCAPCAACVAQAAALFTPAASPTYRPMSCSTSLCQSVAGKCGSGAGQPCSYTYGYASQATTQGTLGTDKLTFSEIPASASGSSSSGSASSGSGSVDIAFGCGYSNQGDFGGAAGLVGMGQSALSLVSQLGASVGGARFSYCLLPTTVAGSPGSPGSTGSTGSTGSASVNAPTTRLVIGAAASASSQARMQFTPMVANPHVVASLYYINVLGFSVSGQLLAIPAATFAIDSQGAGGMILDSGTTYTYLPSAAFALVKQAFDAGLPGLAPHSGHPFLPVCYSNADSAAVPTLTLHLQGADIDVPAANYFIPVDSQGTRCLAIIPTSSPSGLQIVGNMLHQNFEVLYDLDNARIGFLPAGC
jgi:hypothetical protein